MTHYRVIFRVPPMLHEDIHGYLSRVAEINRVSNIELVLGDVLGKRKHHEIHIEDLLNLARYCRVYPDELSQLSGISQRKSGGSLEWEVCGQSITKATFLTNKFAKICPLCLKEDSFVHGEWTLSFYTSCAMHGCSLVEDCKGCGGRLVRNRKNARYCECDFDLANSEICESSEYISMCSELISFKVGKSVSPKSYGFLGLNEFQNLNELSLDGLFKIIWFLGHCIGELKFYSVGHGLERPGINHANAIIEKAFGMVEDWPHRLGNHLIASKNNELSQSGMTVIDKLIGPVQSYYKQELQDSEFGFLISAYEQQVNKLRNSLGKQHRSRWKREQGDFFDY